MNERIAKKVNEYFKFMQDKLQRQFGKHIKSPFQLKDNEKKDFFKQVKKEWEAHKTSKKEVIELPESKELEKIPTEKLPEGKEKLAKKVSEYFKFMQDKLQRQFGKHIKSPFQLKDNEKKDFFKQVKEEWADHKK